MFGKFLGDYWDMFKRLGDAWEMFGRCLGEVWKMIGRSWETILGDNPGR